MTTNDTVADLSVEQLQALLREARDAQKLVQQATAQRYAGIGADLFTALVQESDLTYSRSSAWVGTSQNGMPIEVDGEKYTVSVTITHTAENERRKPIFAEAKKFADEHKLTGDKRKEFLAAALAESEPKPVEV